MYDRLKESEDPVFFQACLMFLNCMRFHKGTHIPHRQQRHVNLNSQQKTRNLGATVDSPTQTYLQLAKVEVTVSIHLGKVTLGTPCLYATALGKMSTHNSSKILKIMRVKKISVTFKHAKHNEILTRKIINFPFSSSSRHLSPSSTKSVLIRSRTCEKDTFLLSKK